MTIRECYEKLHGNYDEAKTRLMNDSLVEKFILKFPGDDSMETIRNGVSSGDNEMAFHGAHTLKGVAANLAFTELYQSASALTEQLRSRENPADPELMDRLEGSYELVIETLRKFESEK